jgi:polysaccharide lyase-like protein
MEFPGQHYETLQPALSHPIIALRRADDLGRRKIAHSLSRPACALLLLLLLPGPPAAGASTCPISNCTIDLNFAGRTADGCKTLDDCINVRRASTKWAAWADGHYSHFGHNSPAITDRGILIEPAATNYVRYSRDLTKPTWEKAGLTATLTATGIDRSANNASTLTATADDGTIRQSIALSFGERTLSAFIRRRSGSGPVTISYDGGATWMPCAVTSDFQRCTATSDNVGNPNIVIKIASRGDSIDVDFVQFEGQRSATSPIHTLTAPLTRAMDVVTISGNAAAPMKSGTFSIVIEGAGSAAGNFKRNTAKLMATSTASVVTVPYEANVVATYNATAPVFFTAVLGTGKSSLLSQGSMAKPFRIGASTSNAAGVSLVGDGGKVVTNPKGFSAGNDAWYLGGEDGLYSGYISRLTIWDTKLADGTLQSLTNLDIPPAAVTDANLSWKNHSVRDQVTISDALYVLQSGTLKDHTTNSHASQVGPSGNYVKFNMFANNPWSRDDARTSGGAERTELAGYEARSRARFEGHAVESIWGADSFYIEKGDPLTTNWFAIGQMHVQAGGVPALAFSLQNGEFLAVDLRADGNAGGRIGRYPIARGVWYHRVFHLKFDQAGKGFVKVWINGAQIVDYSGNTGVSTTQYYYWKFGIYRSQAPEYVAVRYANMTIGTADLSARIAKPVPIPTGYCTDNGSC